MAKTIPLFRQKPEVVPPMPVVGGGTLQEALPMRPGDASVSAFILAALPRGSRPVLWVQDRASRRESGTLYLPGTGKPFPAGPVIHINVSHPRDVLWAMEEGATCAGLAAVVGEVHGAPAILDFTATKRLALRSEASGVPVWLIRSNDPGGLSAARERWRIGALPSSAHPHDVRAPGGAFWEAELFRARGRPPGLWWVRYDPHAADPADRLRLVSPFGDGALAQSRGARSSVAGG
ncbi:MAG: hypothetical protein ABNH26_00375 [Celeribacter sp.]